MEKDLERIGVGLFHVLFLNFPGGSEEKDKKPLSGQAVSQLRLEPRTPECVSKALPLSQQVQI
jgi:hypothetical protein